MDLGDFAKQVPISFILVPIVFGILYIVSMVYIIRRARARRRERAAAQQGGVVAPQAAPARPLASRLSRLPMGSFLSGQLPDHSAPPASWTVPSELRGLPEPDLDMLASPVMIEDMPSTIQAVPEPAVVSAEDSESPQEGRIEVAPIDSAEAAMANPATTPDTSGDDQPITDVELPGDAVEVMRVYRDLSDGRLIVEMGDRRYRTMGEIRNPELTRRFTTLVRDLTAIVNAAPGRATQNFRENAGTVPPPDNTAGGMKAKVGLLNREPEAPKPNIMKGFARTAMGQSSASAIPDSSAGIASAVEEFLQFKLTTSPEFSTRSIHISSTHDHSIRIEVDGHYYGAIGDVVDPDVRDFLFNMMREWEARH